ncbi:MAG: ATP-binding cassette domain-containing protein [Candidatus Izemoplasmatales bacterium]
MASLLRLANIKKSYNITKSQQQVVLKGVDIEFSRGELVALVGESGCGKSTLINILGGLDTEYTGSVVVRDQFIRDFTEKQMDDYRKQRVGMIFQNYNLISHLTLAENIEISMRMSDIDYKTRHQRAMDLLTMIGLHEYANKFPSQLSGGQQQRVAIARALANNPSIILADEPTGALDKESEDIILNILKKIVETGKLVIIVTHSEVVASKCSRIVRLDEGVIISDETKYNINDKSKFEKTIMPKPIKTKDIIKISLNNLYQKLSRSILVSVGLSLGIAALILILNLGKGLTNYVNEVYSDNLQTTQITLTNNNFTTFSDTQIEQILSVDGLATVHQTNTLTNIDYSYGDVSGILGTVSTYYSDYYPSILYGSLPEDTSGIVINEALAAAIGPDGIISSIGTTLEITVDDSVYSYTITGIYDDISSSSDLYNIYFDYTNLTTLLGSDYEANTLLVILESVEYTTNALDEFEALHVNALQADNSANSVLSYIDTGTQVLTGVSAISMVVAAIMIFVVLYITIVERTKEIGILRAIGSRKKDISKMFIVEAGIIGIAGGIFGVLFSFLVTLFTNTITSITLDTTLISYHIGYYAFGIIMSFIVSVIAGIAPAVKAADLDPAVALRYE